MGGTTERKEDEMKMEKNYFVKKIQGGGANTRESPLKKHAGNWY